MGKGRRKVLLVSSTGGVLLDVLALEPWWSRHDTTWVAVPGVDTAGKIPAGRVLWEREQAASSPMAVLGAVSRALRHLRAMRPDVVVSAGTGVAVAYFVAARLLRISTLWIETFNMVGRAGLAARVCGRLADRVLVQRAELVATRRRAVVVGELY